MSTIKGLVASTESFDGTPLRIAIVHARWNKLVIDALVAGAVAKLKACGVKEGNIIIQSVPGSFELPLACSKYVTRCALPAALKGRLTQGHRRVSYPGGRQPARERELPALAARHAVTGRGIVETAV